MVSTFLEIHTMGISDSGTRITLRLPEQLHHKLVVRARKNQRSLNSEIVHALLDSTSTHYATYNSQNKALFVAETNPPTVTATTATTATATKEALLSRCEHMTAAQQAALLKFLSEQ